MKFSRIWSISKEELQNIIYNSISFKEVLNKLDLKHDSGGNYKTLKHRIAYDNLDISKLNLTRYTKRKNIVKDINQLLVVNSTANRHRIKHILIKHKLIKYECQKCGLKNSWQNELLVLQLEHKNGISNDNRLENLCFLCPNCHSQTNTFSGKNKPKIIQSTKICLDCKQNIKKTSVRCRSCSSKIKGIKQQKFKVSKKKLTQLLYTYNNNLSQIANKYNVSSTTVKKYCKKYNINILRV